MNLQKEQNTIREGFFFYAYTMKLSTIVFYVQSKHLHFPLMNLWSPAHSFFMRITHTWIQYVTTHTKISATILEKISLFYADTVFSLWINYKLKLKFCFSTTQLMTLLKVIMMYLQIKTLHLYTLMLLQWISLQKARIHFLCLLFCTCLRTQ